MSQAKKLVGVLCILMLLLYTESCFTPKGAVPTNHYPKYDIDGDGVVNTDDRCPDMPGEIKLSGCPDTDHDGVADIDDHCPNTPPNIATVNGCPDFDNDGVIDSEDKCPTTPGKLSNQGCPLIESGNDFEPPKGNPKDNSGGNYNDVNNNNNAGNSHSQPPPIKHTNNQNDNHNTHAMPPENEQPNASIAYGCKHQAKVGQRIDLRVRVEMNSTETHAQSALNHLMNEPRPVVKENADTAVIKTLSIVGADYFRIVPVYDTSILKIDSTENQTKELNKNGATNWLWRVTALKATNNEEVTIDMKVYAKESDGKWHERDVQTMVLTIVVDKPIVVVKQNSKLLNYLGIALGVLAIAAFAFSFSEKN